MMKKKILGRNRGSILPFSQDVVNEMDDVNLESEIPMDLSIISPKMERKSLGGNRRRSSIGFSARSPLSETEQIRIANMYKLVIQMSSENKINDKNSWNYDLIDHMRNVIRDENKGVNFQKASCTLDASVKIYSHRVDDTYNASYRILENLSRNQHNNPRNEDDCEGEEEGTSSNTKSKGRGNGGRSRTYFANTLGSSEDQFNVEKVENDENFDPMFQKITKSFDEGGAKGLLLYNLKISSNSCSLLFDESLLPSKKSTVGTVGSITDLKNNTHPAVNMKELVRRSKLTFETVKELKICDALKNFRKALKIPEGDVQFSVVNKLKELQARSIDQHAPFSANNEVVVEKVETAANQSSFMDVDCWDNVNDDYSPLHDDVVDNLPPGTGEVTLPSVAMERIEEDPFPVGGKLKWAVNEEDRIKLEVENQEVLQSLDKSNYDVALDSLEVCNAWAGANHWKYGRTRASKQLNVKQTEETSSTSSNSLPPTAIDLQTESKKAKSSVKAVGATFVLTPTYVDESKFGQIKKHDATILSQKVLDKQLETSESTLLPLDQKLQVRDLARLYLFPNYLTAKNKSLINPSSRSSQKEKFMMLFNRFERDDRVLVPSTCTSSLPNAAVTVQTSDPLIDEYAGGSGDYYEENDFGGDYDVPIGSIASDSQSAEAFDLPSLPLKEGLEITHEKLVQCDRKVAKTDVTYAKTSKKVNVHKLKADIWTGIQATISSQEKKMDTEPCEGLTFNHLIHEVSQSQNQQDASIQYYFICLLHLANEKGLKIEGQEDLCDLKIQMDRA